MAPYEMPSSEDCTLLSKFWLSSQKFSILSKQKSLRNNNGTQSKTVVLTVRHRPPFMGVAALPWRVQTWEHSSLPWLAWVQIAPSDLGLRTAGLRAVTVIHQSRGLVNNPCAGHDGSAFP